jgi:hypothetical protein
MTDDDDIIKQERVFSLPRVAAGQERATLSRSRAAGGVAGSRRGSFQAEVGHGVGRIARPKLFQQGSFPKPTTGNGETRLETWLAHDGCGPRFQGTAEGDLRRV